MARSSMVAVARVLVIAAAVAVAASVTDEFGAGGALLCGAVVVLFAEFVLSPFG